MKATVMLGVVAVFCLVMVATPAWSQLEDEAEVTLRLLDDGEAEEQVVRDLVLPQEASEQGRASSAFGLATANAARRQAAQKDAGEDAGEEVEDAEEGEDAEREPIVLPEDASEQARESAAFGLNTANEARERGQEFGQERAAEAREAAAERREEARLAAEQERAVERSEKARKRGRPESVPGRPDGVPGNPRN